MIFLIRFQLTQIGRTIFIVAAVLLVMSVALLVFVISVSCKKNEILRIIITIAFVVVGLAIFGTSIYCLAAKRSILSALEALLDVPTSDSENEGDDPVIHLPGLVPQPDKRPQEAEKGCCKRAGRGRN
jgi:hypothetical protein